MTDRRADLSAEPTPADDSAFEFRLLAVPTPADQVNSWSSFGERRREALRAARAVIAALMTPGAPFPREAQLKRAWTLLRDV